MLRELHSLGINEPYLEEAIRKVAATRGKPEILENLQYYNKVLKRTWDTYAAGKKLVSKPGNLEPVGQAMVTLLKWGLELNPVASLLLDDLTILGPTMYFTSRARIDQFTKLTEEQLKALKVLSSLIKTHVQQLNSAKKCLATLPVAKSLEPPVLPVPLN